MTTRAEETTEILKCVAEGKEKAADRLMPLVYDDFRRLANSYLQQEPVGHTLHPTALVHEAYLKLINHKNVDWRGRTHFFAVGAQAMRRILVDHARGKNRIKRGGDRRRISLDEQLTVSPNRDEDVLDLDEALKKMAEKHGRAAEIVELRFFGGLTVAEAAEVVGVSERTARNDWEFARAWLRRELST